MVVLATLAVVFASVSISIGSGTWAKRRGTSPCTRGSRRPFGGVHFSHVELETDIPVSEVAKLPQYPALSDGITANDRTEAMGIVEQIRQDLTAAAASS